MEHTLEEVLGSFLCKLCLLELLPIVSIFDLSSLFKLARSFLYSSPVLPWMIMETRVVIVSLIAVFGHAASSAAFVSLVIVFFYYAPRPKPRR